jgi:integrase
MSETSAGKRTPIRPPQPSQRAPEPRLAAVVAAERAAQRRSRRQPAANASHAGYRRSHTKASLVRVVLILQVRPVVTHDRVLTGKGGLPLGTDGVEYPCRMLGRKAGIPDLHPHVCRHTFAASLWPRASL